MPPLPGEVCRNRRLLIRLPGFVTRRRSSNDRAPEAEGLSLVGRILRRGNTESASGRCWLNPEHVIWPLREIYFDDRPARDRLVAVSGPPRTQEERRAIDDFVAAGYRLLGISSYQNFPGRVLNPYEYEPVSRFSFFEAYGDQCAGWLHCFRKPGVYLPRRLPRILLPESDFTDYGRIGPERVDRVSIDGVKRYDFGYVCPPGAWNEYCRNWTLGKACVSRLSAQGRSVAVIGRDNLDELAGLPGIHSCPMLPWHEFIKTLAQCRFLLVPNEYDASPRVMAEALCLDIPLLVNKRIIGGWHYVERPSGVFFTGESDFEAAVAKLLRRRFQARRYFVSLFGPEYAGARLGRFIAKLRGR